MSKIFQALQREQGRISELLLPVLGDQDDAATAPGSQANAAPAERAPVEPVATVSAASTRAAPLTASGTPAPICFETVQARLPRFSPMLPFDETNRRAAEQYRIIRTKIIQHPAQPRLLVVSSPAPGDGKSVTAVNIAGALSLKSGGRVLLVDADFRRSTLDAQLGIRTSAGLCDVLAGSCELTRAVVQIEQLPNLHAVLAGRSPANPTELLDTSRWLAMCAQFRRNFAYVVIDSPPIGLVADFDLIQAGCDAGILVVRPDRTERQACFRAIEAVPKDKFLGIVVNVIPKWFFGNNYYDSPYSYYEESKQ